MIEYLNNFLIIAYTIDSKYNIITTIISALQDLIKNNSFSYVQLRNNITQLLIIILEVVSFRTKKISFMKYKYDLISNLYNLWLYPFVLNSNNVENEVKTNTIRNFSKLIELIQNIIENIEKNGVWVSTENDKKLQCLQKICKNLFIEKILDVYFDAIMSSSSSSLSSSSSSSLFFNNNSNLNSKKMETWRVEILSTNNTLNKGQKVEHLSYLSKRFSNFNNYINKDRSIKNVNKYNRAILYFYKSPMYLSKYKDCNLKCLPIITVREFNDRIFLSTNGSSQSLLYEIFIELNDIELNNIRKIFIYGVLDDIYSKKFVGFAFRNSNHFNEIACKKRFNEK